MPSIDRIPVDYLIRFSDRCAYVCSSYLTVWSAAGVGTRQETRQRQREQTSTNWVSRYSNGLCRTGVYYVGVPTTECVTLPLWFALSRVPVQPCNFLERVIKQ